ncbi:MAG: CRISPR-associated endonuclease Cas1 [Candidatus Gerdarchaeota archaeon]|nr:MAG: CRISPR-associated endonuclease Cas1 [Candidatus Gerdarchaeota archaeon]
MIVIVSEHGAKIGKEGRRLYISYPAAEKATNYIPAINLEQLVIEAKATLTSGAIELLTAYGIPVLFFRRGKPVGVMHSFAAHGTVKIRRAQILANTSSKGAKFVISNLKGAMENKVNLLKRVMRSRKIVTEKVVELKKRIKRLEEQRKKDYREYTEEPVKSNREQIFAIEGNATETYFSALKLLIDEKFQFKGRNRRPPKDPINSLLSYGYAILTLKVLAGVIIAGMEPFAGFLHTDRSGKPSFVLDLMEEFRQPVVDKLILKLEGRGIIAQEDFEEKNQMCKIKEEPKKTFLTELYKVFETTMTNSKTGEMKTIEQHIIQQARKAGKFFMGEKEEYEPFIAK